jgi:hypothetical protein
MGKGHRVEVPENQRALHVHLDHCGLQTPSPMALGDESMTWTEEASP